MRYLIPVFVVAALFACRKKELPISPRASGDLKTGSVEMRPDYRYQVYYHLESNSIVGKNLRTDWDLAFSTGADDKHIITNSALAMSAVFFPGKNIMDDINLQNYEDMRVFDPATGNLDSGAFANWWEKSGVYVIDRGFSFTGAALGRRKIQIMEVTNTSYEIKVANLDNSNLTTVKIEKHPEYNYSYLSFEDNQQKIIAPPKDEWDLLFTQYTHIFYEPEPLPYLVNGVWLNPYNTEALRLASPPFEEIDLTYALSQTFSKKWNTIGYKWKSFVDGNFIIHYDVTYLVKDQQELIYKLRFIDFYDDAGQRGTPTWEYVAL